MENEQELKKEEETKREEKKERRKPRFYSDFGDEVQGSYSLILLHNGESLEGKIIENRRYFLKVQVKNDLLYINKAFVVYIMPLHKRA
jgi:hypothetical protein